MISVIIPCYNCADFVSRAINSVLKQTFQNFELILVNNNSTDGTLEILKRYESAYPDRIFVCEEKKPGAPAARNYGLSKANGNWIQFLDSDDELLPWKLQIQYNIAQQDYADVIAGECLLQYTAGEKPFEVVRHVDENPWKGLIASRLGITSSILWRRSSLTAVNGWAEGISSSQEYELLFRLLKNNCNVVADNTVNTIVYFSADSISKSKQTEKIKRILSNRIDLRANIKNYLRNAGLLTTRLEGESDRYIYTEIMTYYPVMPGYANQLLKKHHPKIKPALVLKLRTKALLLYLNTLRNSIW
jgi:glycosyltransferase involved in cell wall biosynthesis